MTGIGYGIPSTLVLGRLKTNQFLEKRRGTSRSSNQVQVAATLLGTGVELCSCERRQLCMYPLQIVDTAGELARGPLPRHARWVASSRYIGRLQNSWLYEQTTMVYGRRLPAALRPHQHLGTCSCNRTVSQHSAPPRNGNRSPWCPRALISRSL